MAGGEVLLEVRGRRVQLMHPLVRILLWELGVKTGADRENVSDSVFLKDVRAIRSHVIT